MSPIAGQTAGQHLFKPSPALSPATPPEQFGGPQGDGAGQFIGPSAIAVDQENGDSYVTDRNNQRIEKFGPGGEFLLAWGWAVQTPGAGLQTCGPQATPPSDECSAGAEGSGAGQFTFPDGVAVDNAPGSPSRGDVYVVDTRNARVEKFTPDGQLIYIVGGEVDKTTDANLCTAASGDECGAGVEATDPGAFTRVTGRSIAVDSGGRLIVADEDRVQWFSSAGEPESQIALPGHGFIEDLAVDSADAIYIRSSSLPGVRKYSETGVELGVPRDELGRPGSIAIGGADELFVAEFEGAILSYDASGTEASVTSDPGGSNALAFSAPAARLFALHADSVHVISPAESGSPYVVPGTQTADEIEPTTATLSATLNPESGSETTYRFEYGTSAAYGQSTSTVELTGGSFEDQHASAALSSLSPRTVYHFRVVATNAAAHTTMGPDETFETLPPVSIDSTSVSQITATSAQLEAELNPHGLLSTYRFEYDTRPYEPGEAGHGTRTPSTSAGSSSIDVAFNNLIEGLAPGTTYHYRVIAENALGAVEGQDRNFTTENTTAQALPDGRAWEMVSPVNKNGIPLEGISEFGNAIQAAVDGGAISYPSRGATDPEAPSNRSFANNQLLSKRGPGGWVTQDIATPHPNPVGLEFASEYRLFSSDLSVAALEPEGATPLSPEASEHTPYEREADGTYVPLVYPGDVPLGTKFGGEESKPEIQHGVSLITATPDLQHVVLRSPFVLTSPPFSIPGGEEAVYEWGAGALSLVTQIPQAGAAVCGGGGASCLASTGSVGGRNARHQISSDGSRIVFSKSDERGTHLYLRDSARQETVQLDVPQPGSAASQTRAEPVYADASVDGARVFFTDTQRLTPDAHGASARPSADLYMCEISVKAAHLACALRNLSVDTHPGEHAEVLGDVLGTSTDGSTVYFVANGRLAEGTVTGNCGSSGSLENTCNLYSMDTTSGATELVAVLTQAEANDWAGNESLQGDLAIMTARVSSSGRYLAFMSRRSLTGYDNRDVHTGLRDQEVFLYDHQTRQLHCVSCNPTGARPRGMVVTGDQPTPLIDRPSNWAEQGVAGLIPGWTQWFENHTLYQSRYLSDSGRLFFDAVDSLVPHDQNGTADVYEYEPPTQEGAPASDSCTTGFTSYSARSEGCVSLISSGTSSEEAAFIDASETGDDVFFLTTSQLVGQDKDRALDVYDAHACSEGSPCPPPPAPSSAACEGDACLSPVSPPNDPTPGSLTFRGPGNTASAALPPKSTPLTRAQKLRNGLKACKKYKAKRTRARCERNVRKRYGPRPHAKRPHRAGRSK